MFDRKVKLTKFGMALAAMYVILTPIMLSFLLAQNGWLTIILISYGVPIIAIILSCKLGKTIAYFFKKSTIKAVLINFATHAAMLGLSLLLFFLTAKIDGDSFVFCMDICSNTDISEASLVIVAIVIFLSLPSLISTLVYAKKFRNPRISYDIDEIIRRSKEIRESKKADN